LVGLDHDALAGALLGRFDHVIDEVVGDTSQTSGTIGGLGAIEDHRPPEVLAFLFDYPETVITSHEHVGCDLLAYPVAGAEVLIDPNHQLGCISHTPKLERFGSSSQLPVRIIAMQDTLARMEEAVGTEIGVGEWMEITQDRVNLFADATDDHQFIHVDPDLAAQTPFGGTIAHGFLTLSLIIPLVATIPFDIGFPQMGVNYGLNKVRFPAPVPVGSRIRARMSLDEVTEVPGGLQLIRTVTVEVEGSEKPAVVAESIVRLYY